MAEPVMAETATTISCGGWSDMPKTSTVGSARNRQAVDDQDVEAVHHLRVTSRRLDAWLSLAQPYLSRRRVAAARRALKRIREAYRKVRDLDVLLSTVRDAANPPPLSEGDRSLLEDLLLLRRKDAHDAAAKRARQAKAARGANRIPGLIAQLADLGAGRPEKPRNGKRRLQRHVRARRSPVDGDSPDAAERTTRHLHELRIALKQFRYA